MASATSYSSLHAQQLATELLSVLSFSGGISLTSVSSLRLTVWPLLQALQFDRLGPDRSPYSLGRQKRLAVQEAATALVCTMLPAIEPVVHVTIKPREKYPLGQTVLRVNEQRELTKQFTRQYLEEQLLTTLAGMPCTPFSAVDTACLSTGNQGQSCKSQARSVKIEHIKCLVLCQ